MLRRLVLTGITLVVAAWLVVALRDARMHDDARQIVRESFRELNETGELSDRAALRRAGRLLDQAELLNPDASVLHDRAIQLFLLGRPRESIDTLLELVDREPENAEAWAALAAIARRPEPRLAARARAEVNRLDPRRTEPGR